MGPKLLFALMAWLGWACVADALDPHQAVSQYVLARWGATSLRSNGVNAVLQTRDRYLWFGTSAGLVRYGGARFILYNARNTPGFGDGGVSSLAQGTDGSLLVGTTSGAVMRYKDGLFTQPIDPGGKGIVSSLLVARDGSAWVGLMGQYVTRWRHGLPAVYTPDLVTPAPLAMVEDDSGAVWIGTRERGLVRHARGQFQRYDITSDTIQALAFDRLGALWIGTPHGLLRMHGQTVMRLTRKHGLSHDDVTAVLSDRNGNLWVGTAGGGLNRLTEGRWTRLTSAEGLSDDEVRCLFEDHEGDLWVGTADGLNCLSDARFVTYGRLEGLSEPAVTSVAAGAQGTVWVGTAAGGVTRLRDGSAESIRLPPGVGREAVLALHEARDGQLWIALDNGRLFRLAAGVVTEHTPFIDQPPEKVRGFFEDELGLVFLVGGNVGLARIQQRRYVRAYPTAPLLRYPHIACRDAHGALWVGSLLGLARYWHGSWRMFTAADGLPHERVRWLCAEPDGSLWAATIGGLAYIKDERIERVTVAEGLPENYLRLVLDDGLGHLWITSTGHIFRLDKRELFALFAGQIRQVSPVIFDASDGLRTTEVLLSNNPGIRAADGRLWLATAKGVSVIDPARVSTDDPAPPAKIEGLRVDGLAEIRTEYPPGRGEVTLEYAALSFRAPSKLRFRYRLDGFDRDWVSAEDQRTAYYSNLPPGQYRFAVMACNRDGVWNGRPATLAFAIQPPFYRTPWFFLVCAAALAAAVASIYRFRVGQMRARFLALIGERTRIARELHDTLAQGLSGVGIQLDTALRRLPDGEGVDRVRRHMQLARSMIRSSLAEVRRSIWVLRAQTSRGEDGLAATLADSLRQLTAEEGPELQVTITGRPRALPIEAERNLLRIAHEAVINAVRHAQAHRLSVSLHFDRMEVHLRVRDDGRGFDPEAFGGQARGHHFGLLGISERARGLGGELRVISRPGAGTEIVCRLPYNCQGQVPDGEGLEGVSL